MAQRLAQGTHNPWVGSSNLSGPTTSERSACPSRAGGYASLCASTHPRKNLMRSIARSQCQTAGGTTVGPTREKVPASRWGRRMRLTRGATCEQCASLECGVCEARPRHSIAPSARRPRHSVASSGAHMHSAAQGPSRWTVPDDSTTAKDIWPTREKVPASYLPRLHNP